MAINCFSLSTFILYHQAWISSPREHKICDIKFKSCNINQLLVIFICKMCQVRQAYSVRVSQRRDSWSVCVITCPMLKQIRRKTMTVYEILITQTISWSLSHPTYDRYPIIVCKGMFFVIIFATLPPFLSPLLSVGSSLSTECSCVLVLLRRWKIGLRY